MGRDQGEVGEGDYVIMMIFMVVIMMVMVMVMVKIMNKFLILKARIEILDFRRQENHLRGLRSC